MVPNQVRSRTALPLELTFKNFSGGPSDNQTQNLPVMDRALERIELMVHVIVN